MECERDWSVSLGATLGDGQKIKNNFSSFSEHCSFSKLFRHFTYVTVHSPTLPSLYLHLSSFPNPSIVSPMSQLILQPFFRFSYVTGALLTSPGEPPMIFVDIHEHIFRFPFVYNRSCTGYNDSTIEVLACYSSQTSLQLELLCFIYKIITSRTSLL